MSRPILTTEGFAVSYAGVAALAPVSFTVQPGERIAVLGTNGAGKSSLLRGLLGLVPAAGNILLGGSPINHLSTAERVRLGVAFVPEGRRVFPGMSVRENLEVACPETSAERRRRRDDAYSLFPQLAARDRDAAWQLSGGQQQMLAIARAMMAKPQLLLMDEPSLGLAPAVAYDVVAALEAIAADTAIILAEQNANLALGIADRAFILDRAQLVFDGTSEEVMERPELLAPGVATVEL